MLSQTSYGRTTGIVGKVAILLVLGLALAGSMDAGAALDSRQARVTSGITDIVFIDSAVEDARDLMNGRLPGTEAVLLRADRNGVEQMLEVLAQHRDIHAVHVISHGRPGEVRLGNMNLSGRNMTRYTTELQALGKSLWADGDILFYGCDVGKGDRGQQFLQQAAQLTLADVAASTDKTGAARLGGNWNLEVQNGFVDSTLPVTLKTLTQFRHILPYPDYEGSCTTGGVAKIKDTGMALYRSYKTPPPAWDSEQTPNFVPIL